MITLVNCVEQNREYPDSFLIPDEGQLNDPNLEAVRIIVIEDRSGLRERMWVKVISNNDGIIVGVVEDKPAFLACLERGSPLEIKHCEVTEIRIKND